MKILMKSLINFRKDPDDTRPAILITFLLPTRTTFRTTATIPIINSDYIRTIMHRTMHVRQCGIPKFVGQNFSSLLSPKDIRRTLVDAD